MPKRKRDHKHDPKKSIQNLKRKLRKLEKSLASSSETDSETSSSQPSEAEVFRVIESDGEGEGELRNQMPILTPAAQVVVAQVHAPAGEERPSPDNAPLHLLRLNRPEVAEGPPIHEEIAKLWRNILSSGIEKEERAPLLQKYPIIKNCSGLLAPKINGEILVALDDARDDVTKKTDNFLSKLQDHLGSGLSALALPVDKLFSNPSEDTNPLLVSLLDAGKLLVDMHHTISLHRRYLIAPSLNPALKKTVEESKIDSLLYGEDFTERLKTKQEIQRSSMQLKIAKPKYKQAAATSATAFRRNVAGPSQGYNYQPKNYRRPSQSTRMKKGEGTQGEKYKRQYKTTPYQSQYKRRK